MDALGGQVEGAFEGDARERGWGVVDDDRDQGFAHETGGVRGLDGQVQRALGRGGQGPGGGGRAGVEGQWVSPRGGDGRHAHDRRLGVDHARLQQHGVRLVAVALLGERDLDQRRGLVDPQRTRL